MEYPKFTSLFELRSWLSTQTKEDAQNYCKSIFAARKKDKNLAYSLTEVETKSLIFPTIRFIENTFGSYTSFNALIGLKNKFIYKHDNFSNKYPEIPIFIDTREQNPIKIQALSENKALNYGDYALSNEEISNGLRIERKSLSDLISTVSGGFDRFQKELFRAEEANCHLIILVEEDLTKSMEFRKLPHIKRFSKAQPSFIWHRIRELIQIHQKIQFLFVGNRFEAARVIPKLLYNGVEYQKYDLQYLYNLSLL